MRINRLIFTKTFVDQQTDLELDSQFTDTQFQLGLCLIRDAYTRASESDVRLLKLLFTRCELVSSQFWVNYLLPTLLGRRFM